MTTPEQNQKLGLLDQLNNWELLRAQYFQQSEWAAYQTACRQLTLLGRQLELLEIQTRQENAV